MSETLTPQDQQRKREQDFHNAIMEVIVVRAVEYRNAVVIWISANYDPELPIEANVSNAEGMVKRGWRP